MNIPVRCTYEAVVVSRLADMASILAKLRVAALVGRPLRPAMGATLVRWLVRHHTHVVVVDGVLRCGPVIWRHISTMHSQSRSERERSGSMIGKCAEDEVASEPTVWRYIPLDRELEGRRWRCAIALSRALPARLLEVALLELALLRAWLEVALLRAHEA